MFAATSGNMVYIYDMFLMHCILKFPEFPEGAESYSILWIGLGRNGFHRMGSAAWLNGLGIGKTVSSNVSRSGYPGLGA